MLSACLTARSDKRGTPAQSTSSTRQARHLHCGRHVGKKAYNPRSHALITTFRKQSTATVQREADNIIPSAAGSVRLLEWLARFPRIPPQVLSARGSAHTGFHSLYSLSSRPSCILRRWHTSAHHPVLDVCCHLAEFGSPPTAPAKTAPCQSLF